MVGVEEVAKWFLSQSSMEHKKLQKLCYYAQAWHCALEGEPLFSERIEAWVHGPVIPVLYHKYKNCGWQKISQVKFDETKLSDSVLEVLNEVLNAVENTYGGFTGEQLEALTHSEAPWQKARGDRIKPYEICTNPINLEDMKEFYLKSYQDAQND